MQKIKTMGRHRSHDILDKVVSGTLPVDQESTKIIPKGGDGESAPTQYIARIDMLPLDESAVEKLSTGGIMREHLSPKKSIGLGREATRLAMQKAMLEVTDTPYDKQEHKAKQEEELEDARDILRNLDTDQAAEMQRLLLAQPESAWMNQQLGIDKNDKRYALIDRLSEKEMSEDAEGNPIESYVVPDEVFQNFLEWHNHVIAERQHELEQQLDTIKDEYKQDIQQAVSEGWVPAEVLERLDKLDTVLVYIDDGLLTNLRARVGEVAVIPQNNYAIVKVSPSQNARDVLRHEFDHILEGQDFGEEDFREHWGRPPESHGLNRLFGTVAGGKVNEAVAEHLRSSFDNGDVDNIDPSHEKRKGYVYEPERKLLDTLANAGIAKVDIRLFIAAYFEDDVNIKKRESHTQELYDQLKEAFPFANVVREINKFTNATDINEYVTNLQERATRYKRRHPLKTLKSKLKAA